MCEYTKSIYDLSACPLSLFKWNAIVSWVCIAGIKIKCTFKNLFRIYVYQNTSEINCIISCNVILNHQLDSSVSDFLASLPIFMNQKGLRKCLLLIIKSTEYYELHIFSRIAQNSAFHRIASRAFII